MLGNISFLGSSERLGKSSEIARSPLQVKLRSQVLDAERVGKCTCPNIEEEFQIFPGAYCNRVEVHTLKIEHFTDFSTVLPDLG